MARNLSRNSQAILIVLILLTEVCLGMITEYKFKRYTYRKKRDDKRYKSARQRCEVGDSRCQGLWTVEHTRCIRKCMSEFCYNELYGDDPLEEGEIDVRLNSFKGCLSQVKMEDF
ncbi:structural maintenance of chromosomes protein [Plakobranchus ocellatus]|uniref:Structural maintenance of chromosomes protein n=1 Tax=Plakobranchus ocellatus TaxID=259542 RepID=A0AAV4B966_9GAST|nr:structural maintenance of chromosomes protein [Plakobranchus ocellatus]